MSGTSLDGLDLALVEFHSKNKQWEFKTIKSTCIEYPFSLKKELQEAIHIEAGKLNDLDDRLGDFIGDRINEHFQHSDIDFISSHGHTVFHQPKKGITLQIGNGRRINQKTGLPVVCDFRSQDVALGGQGAPLVPIGDQLLFTTFGACLNLGGIANISFSKKGKRTAYDIMPFNMALNFLALQCGESFDKDGEIAKKGKLNASLLHDLSSLSYYSTSYPKSLGFEDFEMDWLPKFTANDIDINDRMHTYVYHAAEMIGQAINQETVSSSSILITGGGAHHDYFIEALKKHVRGTVIIPDKELINYKEAIIFAFLGLLRFQGKNNCLASVTGARQDCSSGQMIGF